MMSEMTTELLVPEDEVNTESARYHALVMCLLARLGMYHRRPDFEKVTAIADDLERWPRHVVGFQRVGDVLMGGVDDEESH